MTDRPMARFDDAALEGALRSLGSAIDWPTAAPLAPSGATAGPDVATRVRVRLADPDRRRRADRARLPWAGRPLRRSLVLAMIALLGLAIVAGAAGLGLPGLRILLGGGPTLPPTPTASPTSSASDRPASSPTPTVPAGLGGRLRLGELVSVDVVEARTGMPVRLPTDPRVGQPAAVWIDPARANQVAYVWAASETLPELAEPGIGMVLMRFDGTVDPGYYEKVLGSGTYLERVTVAGHRGYWISGDPHFFYYVRSGSGPVDDPRRWVGDALIWTDGATTYRIESGLGKDASIEVAESIR